MRIKSFTTLLAASCASVTNHHCSLHSSSISHAKTVSTSKQPSARRLSTSKASVLTNWSACLLVCRSVGCHLPHRTNPSCINAIRSPLPTRNSILSPMIIDHLAFSPPLSRTHPLVFSAARRQHKLSRGLISPAS